MKQYKKIFKYLGAYKKTVVLVFVFTVFQVIGTVSLPFIMSEIIDNGIKDHAIDYVLKMGGLMLAVTIVTCFFGIMANRMSGKAASGLGDNLRMAMMEKLCKFSAKDVGYFSKASFINRMTLDVTNVQEMVGIVLNSFITAPITIICIIIITLRINTSMAVIFLIAVPFFSIVAFFIVKCSQPYFRKNAYAQDKMNRILLEDLVGIRLVKAFVREKFMTKDYKESAKEVKKLGLKAEQITNINSPVQALIVNCCIILLLWFGGQKIMNGTIEVGDLFSFITYTNQILYQITLVSIAVVPIIGFLVSVDRVVEVLEKEPSVTDENGDASLEAQDGSLTFEHVYFDYNKDTAPEEMLLQDINLTIRDREMIGIVGATGSGKSTLVNLVPRLFDLKQGRILFGGTDIREMTFANLRKDVSFAPQRSTLFSGSLRQNLLCGFPNASEEDMKAACEQACIYDFVTNHEEGFDIHIDEGGSNVSGGQRQRLCLARAFIKNSRLLIMDDCTSALDKATERAVIDHIVNSYTDRTRILISGKISSIRRMDRIIVLDQGKIAGIGTHEELYRNNEIYKDLCVSQGEV